METHGRPTCLRCGRPEVVCYCAHVEPVATRTRVVILQHPRERDMPIGTARMASLCLPNSELLLGVDFAGDAAFARALSDPSRPAVLLWPGEGARDVFTDPPEGPVTLVVVDGTWSQAKKLVRVNPALAGLPRYAFEAPAPSDYRIRKEPDVAFVSTIEALVYALSALEGEPERFERLLAPFRAMVDAQLGYREAVGHGRHAARRPKPPRRRVPAVFSRRADDMVCVVAEANAWALEEGSRAPVRSDELVQLVAVRPSTGERFERLVAPRGPLSPRTAVHTELREADVLAGCSREDLFTDWSSFLRSTDVLAAWGPFTSGILAATGCTLPETRVDLRRVATDLAKRRIGALDDTLRAFGVAEGPPLGAGRAGRRAAGLGALVRHLVALAREDDVRLPPSIRGA